MLGLWRSHLLTVLLCKWVCCLLIDRGQKLGIDVAPSVAIIDVFRLKIGCIWMVRMLELLNFKIVSKH